MIARFASWLDAFDACMERNRPLVCLVGDEEAKIYPSGRWEARNAAAVIAAPSVCFYGLSGKELEP